MHNKNFKTLPKEKKQVIVRKHIPCSWTGRLNAVEMSIQSKAIYRFNAVPIKIPMMLLAETEKPILKFTWNLKGSQIAKPILKFTWNLKGSQIAKAILKKNKPAWITLSDFKPHYKATVIKAVWYRPKTRHINQWNRIEGISETNSHKYGPMIFDKSDKTNQWRVTIQLEYDSLSHKVFSNNWITTCRRIKLDLYFT